MASAAKKLSVGHRGLRQMRFLHLLGWRMLLCCATLVTALPAVAATDSNAVPVRLLRGYLMIAQVSIDDRGPFDFLVDTGSNTTLLDPGLAAELNLHAKDRLQLTSLANAAAVPRYFLGKLTVGTLSLSNLEALAAPLPELRAVDRKIRGVLGMNFLLHFSFRLDFDTPALELYSSPAEARIPAGLSVPVQINQARLLIPVTSSSAAHGSWKLVLDSGIAQFLVFEHRAAPAGEPSCAGSSCLTQVSTNLSHQQATIRRLRDLSISRERLPEQQVVILRNGLQPSSDPQDGLLPAAPFHSVFFDRSTATLIFSPSPGATTAVAALQAH
jgi:aspartyl protease